MISKTFHALSLLLLMAAFGMPASAAPEYILQRSAETDAQLLDFIQKRSETCGINWDDDNLPRLSEFKLNIPQTVNYMRASYPELRGEPELVVLAYAQEEMDYAIDSLVQSRPELSTFLPAGITLALEYQKCLVDYCLTLAPTEEERTVLKKYFNKTFIPLENKIAALSSAIEDYAYHGGADRFISMLTARLQSVRLFNDLLVSVIEGEDIAAALGTIDSEAYTLLDTMKTFMRDYRRDEQNIYELKSFSAADKKLPAEIAAALPSFPTQTAEALRPLQTNKKTPTPLPASPGDLPPAASSDLIPADSGEGTFADRLLAYLRFLAEELLLL